MRRRKRKQKRSLPRTLTFAGIAILAFGGLVVFLVSKWADPKSGLLVDVAAGVVLATLGIWVVLQEQKDARVRRALLAVGASDPTRLSGVEYETFCVLLLREKGWSAETTPGSGDYGADIVAEKKGRRMVVQCKRWSENVGVTAVQEVHASRSHYKADDAVVVTTMGYTRAARELARTTGVRLMLHQDLLKL